MTSQEQKQNIMNCIIVDSIGPIPQLNKTQKLRRFSQTLSFKLIVVGLLIGVWAFIYKFWLLDIAAPFLFFVPIGDLCYGVALSVIASIIFSLLPFLYRNINQERKSAV